MANVPNNPFFNNLPDFEQQAIEEKIRAHTPAAPTFSLEDMEIARTESYNKGHAEGLEQAKNSIEQKTEILVQSIVDNIQNFENNEIKRQADYINNAVNIAYKAAEKLLHTVLLDQKEALIKQALLDFMDEHTPKTELTLFVHPELEKSVSKYVTMLSPNISLKTDENFNNTQCRMEWVDGTFEFTPDTMVTNILNAINDKIIDDQAVVDETQKIDHNEEEEQKNDPLSEEDES